MGGYLVGAVEEVDGRAEGQRVMVGVPQQDGQDLHPGRPGLPRALLLAPLQGPLAVDGVFPHLGPGNSQSCCVTHWTCKMVRGPPAELQTGASDVGVK